MKPLRWAVVGVGRFGRIHAEIVRDLEGVVLAALCNRSEQKLQEAGREFEVDACYRDVSDLLASDVDVVSITTHWKEHFEVARAALEAGKHVFLEKPMAETTAQCLELVGIASRAPGQLMVGHICRFDPRVAQARDWVRQGKIGRIVSMHAKRNLPVAPGTIRLDKISPLMGDGVHDADLMLWFMERMPTRVYGRNIRVHDYTYPDVGWAMLEFGDDAIGVVETNWCLPTEVPTVIDAVMEITGTDGMLRVDCSVTGLAVTAEDRWQMIDTDYWPVVHGRRTGVLRDELTYFADCVRRNKPADVIRPIEAAAAVAVMEAAEQSAASGTVNSFAFEAPGR